MSDIRTPSSCSVSFRVNGQMVALDLPVHALLLDVLRDGLGLKGAKRSCDVQVCGACTVLVDGAPVSACTYLAIEVDGREVSTVEGLADGDTLHPLQESFIECGAVQCGFCTSGMSTINYNSYPQAPEVMLEPNGDLRLLRRRQSLEQVWMNEV